MASAEVARARAGGLEALEEVYRAYQAPVYNLGRRICGNEEDAEDVLQDTFLEVCLLRRERQRAAGSLDGDGSFAGMVGSAPPEPTAPIDLETALGRLAPLTRAVLWLHDVEGYTHEEIGKLMGKTASFSKSQLSRAHRRLREWLE